MATTPRMIRRACLSRRAWAPSLSELMASAWRSDCHQYLASNLALLEDYAHMPVRVPAAYDMWSSTTWKPFADVVDDDVR